MKAIARILIICLCLMMIPASVFAADSTKDLVENNIRYEIADGKATVVGYKGKPADVVIPESVNGYPVIAIGAEAFLRSDTLRSVVIPATVETIKDGVCDSWIPDQKGAFCRCKKLETVTFAENSKLTYIGENSFSYCASLKSINLPDSLEIIGLSAFENCMSLKKIDLPEGLREIRQNGLSMTGIEKLHLPSSIENFHHIHFLPYLSEYSIADGHEKYRVSDGVLYSYLGYFDNHDNYKEGWILTGYPLMKKDSSYTVPDYVDCIEANDFYAEMVMEKEDDTQYLKEFKNNYLKKMNIGNAMIFTIVNFIYDIEIGEDNPHYSISNGILYSKDGSTVERIPASKTGTVKIPDGVTVIGPDAASFGSFSGVELPDSLKTIDSGAFYYSELRSLEMPDSVTELGVSAFQECHKLENVRLSENISSIGFNTFLECEKLKEIEIPASITKLGNQAFVSCKSLKHVDLPENVQSVGSQCFNNCNDLLWLCIRNSKCDIFDEEYTIPEETVIIGHKGSTAEKYAKKYDRTFISLEDMPDGIPGLNIAAAKDVEVSSFKNRIYSGSYFKPSVTLYVNDRKLVNGTDYSVTYSNNREVGTATVKIKGMGDYTGTITRKFKISPKGTSLIKVTAVKKGFTAKWKKQTTQTTGYQIRYSLKSSMKNAKIRTIKDVKTLSKKVTKLKSGKTYYVQVRTYKAIKGKNYVSTWSKKIKVKTKT